MGRWSWSSDAWDFDHDGFADLYISNGMVSGPLRDDLNSFFWRQVVANSPDAAKPSPAYEQGWSAVNELLRADYSWSGFERNVFYANNRDGTFSDVSGAVGLDFVEDGRAFALADFDHDGDLDLFLTTNGGPAILLRNDGGNKNQWLNVRLNGTKSNRSAIGARVLIRTPAGLQMREVRSGSSYLSQPDLRPLFGLGDVTRPDQVRVTIRWPSGIVQPVPLTALNRYLTVLEAGGQVAG